MQVVTGKRGERRKGSLGLSLRRQEQGVYGRGISLVYVDFTTQKRIPRLSAQWFREAAARNAVV